MDHAAIAARMVELFCSESLLGLRTMKSLLVEPLATLGTEKNIDTVYRIWHTMRGSASMVGLDGLASLLARAEDQWSMLREQPQRLHHTDSHLALEMAEALAEVIEHQDVVAAESSDIWLPWHARWGATSAEDILLSEGETGALSAQMVSGTSLWLIRFEPNAELLRRGVDVLGLIDELTCLGDVQVQSRADRIPALQVMEPDQVYLYWDILFCGPVERNVLEDVFMFVSGDSVVHIECLVETLPQHWQWDSMRAREAMSLYGSALDQDSASNVLNALGLGSQRSVSGSKSLEQLAQEGVWVSRDRLDRQIDLVGELVIAQSALLQIALQRQDDALSNAVEQVVRLADEMRDSALQLRMVPARELFTRLEHDAQALQCEGHDVELDKGVIEALYTPLLACMREHPLAQRFDLSLIKADQSLNLELRCSLVDVAQDIVQVLEPVAAHLRAELQVVAQSPMSSVCMRLPLSQDIIDGLLVEAWGQTFIVPLALVSEVVDLQTLHQVAKHEQDLLNLRGVLVPFIRLATVFAGALPQVQQEELQKNEGKVLIARGDAGKQLGVLVDRVLGQQQVFIKPTPLMYADVQGLAGTTILGDGRVGLILDVMTILRQAHMGQGALDE